MKTQIVTKHAGQIVASIVSVLLLVSSGLAAPIIRQAAGANPAAIQSAVDQFRADLGNNNGVGGSFATGRREINWDGVPDAFAAPNVLPANFFNVNSPRGVIFTSIPDGTSAPTGLSNFAVSATAASGTPVRFGDVNATYSSIFQTFSAERLFRVRDSRLMEITFFIPGTNIPATVGGFGAVFCDVDNTGGPSGVLIHYFKADGTPLISVGVPASNNGLSFAGVFFDQGERIARVMISLGNTELGAANTDGVGGVEVATMDDFIYGEPRAMQYHTADFDGDGTSDTSVFRPSTGQWFILNSGSNTFSGVPFGQNGDIPLDGDFDGDQRADMAVFRPSAGTFFIIKSSNGQFVASPFGQNGDRPVPGDYDKDGKTDIAIYRPSVGQWFILRSSDNTVQGQQFGAPGDIPFAGAAQ